MSDATGAAIDAAALYTGRTLARGAAIVGLDSAINYSIGFVDGAAAGQPIGLAFGLGAGRTAGYDEGFEAGSEFGVQSAPLPAPPVPPFIGGATLSNITPDPGERPGDPGAFSIDFKIARITPIEFDVTGIAGRVTIAVSFGDRNESYQVLDVDGVFRWPFDVPSQNTIGVGDPAHVRLFPRGGWPPTVVRIQVATSVAAG